jgi:hypothetical protein
MKACRKLWSVVAAQRLGTFIIFVVGAGLLMQCSDTVEPELPSTIEIVSGDMQFSQRGSQLPKPFVVRVRSQSGGVPESATIIFQTIAGNGIASPDVVAATDQGLAETRYTLGSDVGTHLIRASVNNQPDKFVVFEATSSNFFCPEQEDTFRISHGTAGHLYLATTKSSLFGDNSAGIVRVNPSIQSASEFVEIPPANFITTVVFDVAFSPRGDFYLARRLFFPEIVKIDVNGLLSQFARLDISTIDDKVEIAANPSGLLVGVDLKGPFVVGCQDPIRRFSEASYTDEINNDALAVDPRRQSQDILGEDIYFIHKTDRQLYRLAMDSLSVETARGLESVTPLSSEQATWARGMVCDNDGNVYILVDSDNTKELLQVTPAGGLSVLVDFFVQRGAGDAAGIQRDLAYKSPSTLFTLDTQNNKLLRYDIGGGFFELFADSLEQSKLSEFAYEDTAQTILTGGEPVGLDVLK